MLLQNRSFGFRDAANYYYPLFEWECRECSEGRVPLWNPLDNGGTPVLADTTSSVLYPGKLVFAMPVSYRLRYHLYGTAHVLLAAGMAYLLARRWRCSIEASGLAAISYAFGGSILFQYCNVVFLVGAAWLPFAVLATDRMLRERSFGWALTMGATLALMVLGGDPQAAYHVGMLAALYALLLRYDSGSSAAPTAMPWRCRRPVLLAAAASAGLCLALVQILPAVEWTRHSSRDSPDAPRNVYEAASSLTSGKATNSRDISDGLLGAPQAGSHLQHVYEFSVGPWHLAEFVWPNFFGRIFPVNERWSTAIPTEGRTWTPSLYLGLLPFVLALCSWRLRQCNAQVRFVSSITALAIMASFGAYGIGWLVHEVRVTVMSASPDHLAVGHPVGGLYWLFVTLLPGYVYFRYPAKLLVIASLGISMLAARGWDEFVAVRSRRIAIPFIVLTAVSLLVAAAFGLFQNSWQVWLAAAPTDAIFGPLDIDAATSGVLWTLLHTAVLGLMCWFLLSTTNKYFHRSRGILLIATTAVELCFANGWMTLTIPANIWSEKLTLAGAIETATDSSVPPRLFRQSAASLLPTEWGKESDQHRLEKVVAWERATMLPKHHLGSNVSMIGSHTTLTSADWQSYLRVARERDGSDSASQVGLQTRAMSVQFIATSDEVAASDASLESAGLAIDGVRLQVDSKAFPRAWIVRNIEVLPPLANRSRSNIDNRTRHVFFDNELPRDLRSIAIIETTEGTPNSDSLRENPIVAAVAPARWAGRGKLLRLRPEGIADEQRIASNDDPCAIKHYSSQRVEIEASLTAPGCVVFNDTFYPGWSAVRVTDGVTKELPIYRANRLMRAVILPAGKHRVVYTYRPQRVILGGIVSSCAWLLLLGYAVRCCINSSGVGVVRRP